MKRRQVSERRLGRLAAAPERRANRLDRGAKRDRPREEIGGEVGALGQLASQPFGLLGGQRLRVAQPVDDVLGLAQVVLMRGRAAPGFGVGEIEREVVANQRQRAGAGGGKLGLGNRH